MLESENNQYQHESQCQDYADYGPEGYHPVTLGQKFNQKYVVIQKLGWGHFSTVWLIHNETNNSYSAMKIQRSKQSHAQSALDELQILSEIRKHQNDQKWLDFLKNLQKQYPQLIKSNLCRPLVLLDNFPHYGIHGKHYCSVFQILGPNLLDLIQHYEFNQQRMPLWLVKKITIDTLLGLVYLHEQCDIIHTDLKPENIMIKLEPHQQAQLVQQIQAYKIKPISMKYLKNIQTSKNSKNKKKKLKKKKKKEEGQNQAIDAAQVEDQQFSNKNQSHSKDHESQQHSSSLELSAKKNTQTENQFSNNIQAQPSKVQTNKKEDNIISQTQNEMALTLQQKRNKIQVQGEQKQKQKWDPLVLKWKNVKIDLNYKIFFKIVDMGNACFSNKHFTQGIQTRQYRAPQVILGHPYTHNTDVWSLGCTVFELMTNNFLFKPKRIEGISKDEDHLYKMTQVLGPMPKEFAISGTQSSQVYNKKGKLIHGNPKQHLPISKLLIQDYGYDSMMAKQAQEFLLPMLTYEPTRRISARQCLQNVWLWK